jgi:hypothetical protein
MDKHERALGIVVDQPKTNCCQLPAGNTVQTDSGFDTPKLLKGLVALADACQQGL